MRAVQLVQHGKPGRFALVDLPEAEPGPGEVAIEVEACGLNHLDLWLEEGALPIPMGLPRIPGCEPAGKIASLGAGTAGWKIGDPVAVQSNIFCGTCEFCLQGEESVCLNGKLLGIDRDGGFAERLVVPERLLVRRPGGVSALHSASLTLAASTAMHMLTDRVTVNPGMWVLVMGAASGVGSAAIQIARQLSARVITTASSPQKAELGLKLGAEQVIDLKDHDWPVQVRKLTGKKGVDIIVEHLGGAILRDCFGCLARNGVIVTCGATAGREVTLNLWPLFVKQQKLVGSYGRNRSDIEAVLEWAAEGKLRPVLGGTYELKETPEAFRDLRARQILGKAVVVMASS